MSEDDDDDFTPPWDDENDDDAPDEGIAPPDYGIGDPIRLCFAFTDAAGLADPVITTCVITTPAGKETTYTYMVDVELVRESKGRYYLDYSPSVEGNHTYRFVGDGIASVHGIVIVYGSAKGAKVAKTERTAMSEDELMTEACDAAFIEAVGAERAYYDSSRSWTPAELEAAKRRLELAKWNLEDLGKKRSAMFSAAKRGGKQ